MRWAAPTALGAGDCSSEANACTLAKAVDGSQGAHADDEVILVSDHGVFNVSDPVSASVRLTIHGKDAAPRPTIRFEDGVAGTDAISLVGNSTLRHLRIERVNGGTGSSAIFIYDVGDVVEDVEVVASGTAQHGIYASRPLTIRDSTVWDTGSGLGGAITLDDTTGNSSVIVNVTAIGANNNAAILAKDGGISGHKVSAEITNTIARSDEGGYSDINLNMSGSSTASLGVRSSNFGTVSYGHLVDCSDTQPVAVHDCYANQRTSPPLLANTATGDFHQLAGSPTIDFGAPLLDLGPTDLDGDPRTLGTGPDIGADEFRPTETLTIAKGGAGQGTVRVAPSGLECASFCAFGFEWGSTVTLTAVPAPGSAFSSWGGGGCTGNSSCTIRLTGPVTVNATFGIQPPPPTRHVLTVAKAGSGQGTVTSSSGGISCGSACRQTYDHGAHVTLTAAASAGSVFSGWTGGGCTGSGACSVTVGADLTVTATFAAQHVRRDIPTLSALAVSPRTFTLAGRRVNGRCQATSKANRTRPRCARTIALQVGYRLNMPARVTITIARRSSGRLVNGRCVAGTRANRSRRPCTLRTSVPGTIVRSGTIGINRLAFDGRIGGRKLGAGAYTLTAAPVAGGLAGAAKTVTFVIGA